MARRFRSRRRRKRYLWTGVQSGTTLPGSPSTVAFILADAAALGPFGGAVDLLVERCVFDINITNTAESDATIGAYLTVLQTGEDVAQATGVWSPLSADADVFNKRPMWWRRFRAHGGGEQVGTGVGPGTAGDPFDVNVKRKLHADEILAIVMNTTNGSNEVVVSVLGRALLSAGPRS